MMSALAKTVNGALLPTTLLHRDDDETKKSRAQKSPA
jgi:hypothetical protein